MKRSGEGERRPPPPASPTVSSTEPTALAAEGGAEVPAAVTAEANAAEGAGSETDEEDGALSPVSALREAKRNVELAMLPMPERKRDTDAAIRERAALVQLAIEARHQHRPDEAPFEYSAGAAHAGLSRSYP